MDVVPVVGLAVLLVLEGVEVLECLVLAVLVLPYLIYSYLALVALHYILVYYLHVFIKVFCILISTN